MNLPDLESLLSSFSSLTRLYDLRFKNTNAATANLLVEAFLAVEAVQSINARDIIFLSTHGELPLATLLGQQASLDISLANAPVPVSPA